MISTVALSDVYESHAQTSFDPDLAFTSRPEHGPWIRHSLGSPKQDPFSSRC